MMPRPSGVLALSEETRAGEGTLEGSAPNPSSQRPGSPLAQVAVRSPPVPSWAVGLGHEAGHRGQPRGSREARAHGLRMGLRSKQRALRQGTHSLEPCPLRHAPAGPPTVGLPGVPLAVCSGVP